MRIAYLARWDISHESGILKKMVAQMRTWVELGHEVRFFAFSPGESAWDGLAGIELEAVHGDDLVRRILNTNRSTERVRSWKPDILYLRWSTYYPAWERLAKAYPTVIELNGDDIRDNNISLPYPLYLAHRATRGLLLRRADGMVSVSRELAANPAYTRFGKPIRIIGNGVDLRAIRPLPPPNNPAPRVIFVGYADRPWHGVDKLLALAARFPRWTFDIVGAHSRTLHTPESNVNIHPHLEYPEYLDLLRQADVAIGTLALHRKNLESTSAIKTGEYLAHGIPSIIAYEDTDLRDGNPHLLQLPNTEDNVLNGLDEIVEFVNRVRGQRVARESILHLDLMTKERERLEFLQHTLDRVG